MVCRKQLNTSGVTLNADLEPKTHHKTPMTYGYIWIQSFHTFQNCCNRGGNSIFKYINFFVATVSLLKKGVSQYFCPYNECTSHWCLVMSFWLI